MSTVNTLTLSSSSRNSDRERTASRLKQISSFPEGLVLSKASIVQTWVVTSPAPQTIAGQVLDDVIQLVALRLWNCVLYVFHRTGWVENGTKRELCNWLHVPSNQEEIKQQECLAIASWDPLGADLEELLDDRDRWVQVDAEDLR